MEKKATDWGGESFFVFVGGVPYMLDVFGCFPLHERSKFLFGGAVYLVERFSFGVYPFDPAILASA